MTYNLNVFYYVFLSYGRNDRGAAANRQLAMPSPILSRLGGERPRSR